MDILLDGSGDVCISKQGDILLGDSISQKVKIKIQWFAGEWRWNPEEGLPYFDSLFIKNPQIETFKNELRRVIFDITEITEIKDVSISFDNKTRVGTISVYALTDTETIREEVEVQWKITE